MDTIVPEDHRQTVDLVVKTMLSLSETYTPEGVRSWLFRPNGRFYGRAPIDLLYEGSDEPWRLAEGMADGVFL